MSLHVLLQWSKQQQYTTLMGLKYLTYNMDAVTSLTYAQEYRSKTAGVLALQRKKTRLLRHLLPASCHHIAR